MNEAIETQHDKLAIQNRISADMREIWALQPRFDRVLDGRGGRTAIKLLEHPRFRAAYYFMLLRAESGEIDIAIAKWWTDFIDADPEARNEMANTRPSPGQRTVAGEAGIDSAAPKRRRRRRRKSGDEAAGAADPA
jgi:poly(A) polymerase